MTHKNLILWISLAWILVGCGKGLDSVLPEDEPIGFAWYASRSATKADAGYYVGGDGSSQGATHLPAGKSFGVFGYFHPQSGSAANPVAGGWKDGVNNNYPNLFYNQDVSISVDLQGYYSYNYPNDRYWPRNEFDRISFIAYYPYNPVIYSEGDHTDATVEPFLDSGYTREGMVGFYYTVPQNSADHKDFMISDLCLDQSKAVWLKDHNQGLTIGTEATATEDKVGTVKFFFHHALSQVRIKNINFDVSGNSSISVKINYIRFNKVAVFGQCIPVPDFTQTTSTGRTPVTPTWPANTLSQTRGNLTSGVGANVCYDYTDPSNPILIPENVLLMIPHQFFNGATIEVNFDVERAEDSTGEYYSYKNNTLTAPLTTFSVRGWEPGKIYNYNITLNLKKINIDAEVVDWIEAGDDVIMDQ